MLTSAELDNILVAQKNQIINLINEGRYSAAIGAIAVVSEFWKETGYYYKALELRQRIEKLGY